jgi:hypothetical protein
MGAPIPNDTLQPSRAIEYLHFGIAVGGVIFGSIHVAAWNFDFPTPIERAVHCAAASYVHQPSHQRVFYSNPPIAD